MFHCAEELMGKLLMSEHAFDDGFDPDTYA